MSNDVEKTPAVEMTEAERIDKAAAYFTEMMDHLNTVPDAMVITKKLMTFLAVHVDENGNMEPEQDPLNVQFLGAIGALESRIMDIERRLGM